MRDEMIMDDCTEEEIWRAQRMPEEPVDDSEETAPRDSQFIGFAKLLLEELMQTRALDIANAGRTWNADQVQRFFAQRAYDLVEHALERAPVIEYEYTADHIPDMTKWPEESKTNE